MGYPRKSYPHRFSPPCAKRSRPRACARVYIIYRSPVGRSRGVSAPLWERGRAVVAPCPAPPCAGWGRARAKADAPSRSNAHFPRLRSRTCPPKTAPLPAYGRITVRKGGSAQGNPRSCPCVLPASARLRPRPRPLVCRITVRKGGSAQGNPRPCPCVLPAAACLRPCPCRLCAESLCAKAECTRQSPPLWPRGPRRRAQGGGGRRQRRTPPRAATRPCLSTAPPPPPKWAPHLRRREGKRPNGAPPHHNAHTPNSARKRYLHNSRTMTQRRTKRCAQFVFFVFTPCKLLHNFSTVLHRSPRNVPKRAQMAARRPDFPCFTARFSNVLPESHRAKHPRTGPVLPPKNAPLRAYAKPRPHSRVRGTRQHATTCAFFTFSTRYEQGGGARNANFCPAEGRKWGRFRSQMLKNGPQTKKSTFSFGRLVI